MTSEVQNAAIYVLEKLGTYDDTQARVEGIRRESLNIKTCKQKTEVMRHSQRNALVIEVFSRGRYAQFSTSDLIRQSLDQFVERAVELTRCLQPDEHWRLPDKARYLNPLDEAEFSNDDLRQRMIEGVDSSGDLELEDPHLAELSNDACIELARRAESGAREHASKEAAGALNLARGHFSMVQGARLMCASNGLLVGERSSVVSVFVEASYHGDGDKGEKPNDYAYASTRYLSDLPEVESIGAQASMRALRQRKRGKLNSGKYALIFENRVASEFLHAWLGPLSGKALEQKSSYFVDRMGQSVASSAVTVTDEPLLARALGTRAFDAEGMASQRRVMVEDGVLRHAYFGTYEASKLGESVTSGQASNIVLKPGDKTIEEMIAGLSRGILVTGIMGGNMDATRGDFSHGLQGLYIENGQIVRAVSGINMTGNHTELWHRLSAIGKDVNVYDSVRCPSLLFDDVVISGC